MTINDDPSIGDAGLAGGSAVAAVTAIESSVVAPVCRARRSAGEAIEQVCALPHSPAAAGLARRWLVDEVVGLPAERAEDAVLLASELVSNAIRYGQPEACISVRITPSSLRVAVTDQANTMPVLPVGPPGLAQRSGRGLFLVVSLATSWGIDRHFSGTGKTVWFTL